MKCSGVFPPAVAGAAAKGHIWGWSPDVPAETARDWPLPPAPPEAATGSIQKVLPVPLLGAGATAHMAVAGTGIMLAFLKIPDDGPPAS